MKQVQVYRCLCDMTRLRILNLLLEGPLCVCHLGEILGIQQPKVSRHLKSLKAVGAVVTTRCYNWTIYQLEKKRGAVLEANLKCLQDLRGEVTQFQTDLLQRDRTVKRAMAKDCTTLPEQIRSISLGKS